ncbi:MAG: hypothetical protein LBU76_04975 [Azoarcus sp.]|jgi:hypothetical protein|nr:hypothetical protein [Azoarcus sp.]
MNASLPHKTWNRLFAGILATALSLGCCFPAAALPTTAQPQAGEDSGTETPQPPMPKPVM